MVYLFRMAWKYAREDRWKVVLFHVLHSISFCGHLLQPYAFGRAINALQTHGIANLAPTAKWLGIYVGGFFLFEVLHRPGQYFVTTTGLKNQQRFIDDMYHRIYRLPIQWHVDHHSGEMVNRINIAGLALRDFSFTQRQYLENLFMSIGPIVVLVSISWQIAVISLIITALNLVLVEKMNRIIQPMLDRQNEHFHKFAARLVDFVSNIRTVTSLKLEQPSTQELKKRFDGYYRESMNEFWVNQPRCFVIAFGSILAELATISYYLWSAKASMTPILVGNLVMIVNYLRQMDDGFGQITSSFYDTLRWKASIKSVDPILEAASRPLASDDSPSSWNHMQLRDLTFCYSKEDSSLVGLSLDLARSGRIAVVGLSGSGKSTLLNILGGLYEPDQVTLDVDGTKHEKLGPLVNLTTLVPQDPEVFENTIYYNITFGLEAEQNELKRAMDTAQFSDVLHRLPKGLETDVREKGVNLSGGEKQRLALARGLYFAKDKDILLLDEVTSSVDAMNERMIFQQLFQNYPDHSVIASIHRLHLAEMFDTVLVMEGGRLVQAGSFAELQSSDGPFRKLWKHYLTGTEEELLAAESAV